MRNPFHCHIIDNRHPDLGPYVCKAGTMEASWRNGVAFRIPRRRVLLVLWDS